VINNSNIGVIIQVRMGSTRLPGKVMKEILGKPMLWHIINRVEKAKYVDDIIVATTLNKEDDEIEDFTKEYRFNIYRGSENDLIDRYYKAARKYNVDIIVRIWGDCPFIDPEIIDKVLEKFIQKDYDYANNFNPATYPHGMNFEVYTFKSLERVWKKAKDTFYRQYPFEYIYSYEDSFKTFYDKNEADLSDINLTVDYIQDFQLVTKIFKKFFRLNNIFHLEDIIKFLEKNPGLLNINATLERNLEYKGHLEKRKNKSRIY